MGKLCHGVYTFEKFLLTPENNASIYIPLPNMLLFLNFFKYRIKKICFWYSFKVEKWTVYKCQDFHFWITVVYPLFWFLLGILPFLVILPFLLAVKAPSPWDCGSYLWCGLGAFFLKHCDEPFSQPTMSKNTWTFQLSIFSFTFLNSMY